MPGLLDFLNTPEASMGLGLMAAGGPTTDPNAAGFGASLARGVQMGRAMEDQQTDKALKQAYLQGQIDAQKRAEREYADKKSAQSSYLGLLGFAPGAPGAAGGMATGGAPAGAGPSTAPGAAGAPGGGQFSLGGLSPEQVLAMQAYAKQSGMPDPTEVWKLARPDMQVSGGYAYDKNRVQPGFLPSLNVSQNGQASMVLPGPNGLPVVMAPQGAVDTARAYADVGNVSRSMYTPGAPGIMDGGRKGGQSQAAEIGLVPPPWQKGSGPAIGVNAPGYASEPAMRGTAALQTDAATAEAARREIAAMQRDLATPGKVPDQASRAAIQAEIQRLSGQLAANPAAASNPAIGPGAAVVPAGGVEFSPEEKAQQEAAKTKAVKTAEGEVSKELDKQKALNSGNDMLQVIEKVLNHPGRETATGTSSALDPRNYMPGTQARNFRVALDQLKGQTFLQAFTSLKGAGAITEQEGTKAESAIARLDTAQSDEEFKNAILDVKAVVERGLKVARGEKVPDAPLPTAGGIPSGWTVKVN